jgi:hypothetical protein
MFHPKVFEAHGKHLTLRAKEKHFLTKVRYVVLYARRGDTDIRQPALE